MNKKKSLIQNKNKIVLALVLSYFAFTPEGCILDSVKKLPVNVATSIEFSASDISFSNFPMNGEYCLSESDDYMKYINDINKITFIGMTYRTKSVSDRLIANLLITLTYSGHPFFSKTLNNFNPADYLPPNKPLEIHLTEESEKRLNNFLNDNTVLPEHKCFAGTATVQIIAGSQPYALDSYIDVALQLDTNF